MAELTELRFPSDLGTGRIKNYIRFQFYEKTKTSPSVTYDPTSVNLAKYKRNKPDIFLPITTDLFRDVLGVAYNETSLGVLGSLLYNEAKRMNDLSPESIERVFSNAMSSEAIKNGIKSYVNTQITTSSLDAVKAYAYKNGMAYNQNLMLMFNGTASHYRFFRLSWTLRPNNVSEADTILKIEKTFLKNILPTTANGGMNSKDLKYDNHFKYPYEIWMTVYINNEPFEKFNILPCFGIFFDASHEEHQEGLELSLMKKGDSRVYYTQTILNLGLQEKEQFTRESVTFARKPNQIVEDIFK